VNRIIRRKLMKAEKPSMDIEQWYKYATNLNRHWRESRREEERLKGKKESGYQRQKQTGIENNQGEFRP